MVQVQAGDHQFYLDGFLKKKLDSVKRIVNKRNFDCCIIIDGLERIGKSTLGITCAYYLSEGKFNVDNIAIDTDDAVNKIEKLPDKSVLLIDEGSLLFSSKDSMNREQKKLIKILNVVGQKNMIFIIVLPCIFDMNKQIAVRRSKFLLHCYADDNLNRGRFAYFGENKKKMLYQIGKKNFDSYSKPSAEFIGRFVDFNPLGEEYLEAKKKSLMSSLHEGVTKTPEEHKADRTKQIIGFIEKYVFPFKMSQEKKAEMIGISRETYNRYKNNVITKENL